MYARSAIVSLIFLKQSQNIMASIIASQVNGRLIPREAIIGLFSAGMCAAERDAENSITISIVIEKVIILNAPLIIGYIFLLLSNSCFFSESDSELYPDCFILSSILSIESLFCLRS